MSYAVLNVKTGLYYNPSKPGNRRDPTFHKKPKLYSRKGHAERALAFCRSGVNSHWAPATTFVPINCELVEFTDPQPRSNHMRMFFYGTLKRGYYNNPRLRLDDPKVATFVGNAVLKDYGIIMSGILPYAVKAPGNKLEGEVFDVHDENIADLIERMEVGAGYNGVEVEVYSTETDSSYKVNFYLGRHEVDEDDKVLSKYDHPDARI